MSGNFKLFSWIWGRKHRGRRCNPPPSLSSDSAVSDPDSTSLSSGKGPRGRRRAKTRRQRPEERRIDAEHDAVIVSFNCGYISDCESDASDWSVGWSEPHAPEFQSKTGTEDSFAVLVPCYSRRGQAEEAESSNKHALVPIDRRDDDFLDRNADIERWLAEHGSTGPIK